jgi:hypothetical protein
MTKELPPHSVIRTLTVHDIDAILVNESAGFPPEERCTLEKLQYRLKVCPELSAGVFIRQFDNSPEPRATATSSTASSLPGANHQTPVENHRDSSTSPEPLNESDEETANATDADTDFVVKPVTLPAGKSSMVSEKLIAHILGTKTTSMFITDESMQIPDIDEYGRRKDPNDLRGHKEEGRTIGVHSLVVDPTFQGRSVGSILIKDYIQRITTQHIADRISLIAHPELVPYYKRFDFVDHGLSEVKFAGAGWHDMSVPLKDEDDDLSV